MKCECWNKWGSQIVCTGPFSLLEGVQRNKSGCINRMSWLKNLDAAEKTTVVRHWVPAWGCTVHFCYFFIHSPYLVPHTGCPNEDSTVHWVLTPCCAIKCLGWWKNKSCLSHTGHLKLKCVFLSIVSFSALHLKGGTDPDVTLTDAVMNHRQQEMENTYTAVFGWGLCAINKHKGCFSSVKSRKLWIISY